MKNILSYFIIALVVYRLYTKIYSGIESPEKIFGMEMSGYLFVVIYILLGLGAVFNIIRRNKAENNT